MENTMENGFVKGTQIRIDSKDFWKPIEEIQVGDMVLSIPENGIGEPVFKRVVNTFKFENREIWYIGVYDLDQDSSKLDADDLYNLSGYFGMTATHSFLAIGRGSKTISMQVGDKIYEGNTVGNLDSFIAFEKPEWRRADELKFNDVLFNPETGRKYCVAKSLPMFKFYLDRPRYGYKDNTKLAWINFRPSFSRISNLSENKLVEFGTLFDMDSIDISGRFKEVSSSVSNVEMQITENYKDGYQKFTETVYNIEVEDNHTYMIGYQGILVGSGR